MSRLPLALVIGLLVATAAQGQITINGSGPSFPSIQAAIVAASNGDVIDVGAGTYFENLNLGGKHLRIEGAGAGLTILDGSGTGRCLSILQGSPGTTRIENMTIRNGRHPGGFTNPMERSGGGILARGQGPLSWTLRLEDLIIENCEADLGGGVFAEPFIDLVIKNSIIRQNGQHPTIAAPVGSAGGGVFGGTMEIEDCLIENNSCDGLTGPAGPYGFGGGVYCELAPGDLKLSRTTIRGNHAHIGGGIAANPVGDVEIMDCIIRGNTTDQLDSGSAIDVVGQSNSFMTPPTTELLIDNCLITGNQFAPGGTLGPATAIFALAPTITIQRSTITRNGAAAPFGPPPTTIEAFLPAPIPGSQFAIRNSIVSGNFDERVTAQGFASVVTTRSLLALPVQIFGGSATNNTGLIVGLDPAFKDPAGGDLQLRPGSPAVDAGNAGPGTPSQDLLGLPRVVGAAPDMGCFELQNQDPGPAFAGTTSTSDVLSFNGTSGGITRSVTVDAGSICTIAVAAPTPGLPAPFILWGYLGVPGPAQAFPIPFAGGSMAFLPHLLGIGDPLLFTFSNNILSPNSGLLFSTPAPWQATGPCAPFPITMTLQGLIVDGPGALRLTNAMTLHAR